MRRMMKLTPILALLALAACETVQGAGRDMQTAGAALTQQAAQSQTQIGNYAPPGNGPVAAPPY